MKNDLTTTFLNFLLIGLMVICVVLAVMNMQRTAEYGQLQGQLAKAQFDAARAQALANDAINYNATVKNPELNQILQGIMTPQNPQAPATK
jgi:hypothetical protein